MQDGEKDGRAEEVNSEHDDWEKGWTDDCAQFVQDGWKL